MELTSEDRLALYDLYAQYAHSVDSGDVDGWCSLFSENARLSTSTGDEVRGQEALRAYCERLVAMQEASNTSHHMSNFVFGATAGGARGACYFIALRVGPDGELRFRALGRYEDDLVNEGGRWVIASRRLTISATAGPSGAEFQFVHTAGR